jgi:hypothetical protein
VGEIAMNYFENGRKRALGMIKNGKPKIIASGDGFDFWLIGNEIYRTRMNSGLDTDGMPMGKRWECSLERWKQYRQVFSWAKDV